KEGEAPAEPLTVHGRVYRKAARGSVALPFDRRTDRLPGRLHVVRIATELVADVLDGTLSAHAVPRRVERRRERADPELARRYSDDAPAYAALRRETHV